ncbi:MAG: glyoxylate reductase [Microgenomates group bacterium Gr01-1014_16]|nr:MAG: glyoxylate reductase [Microgenomates group bacterium Gr01-1014_16]
MMYKKIVILDSVIIYPEHRDRLNKIAEEVVEYNTCETEQEVLDRVRGADCIVSCWINIPNKVIDENPQLKTIAFWTHAFEHRINSDYALKHHIYVPSIPDYGTDSVAELVFIGLLQLNKKLSDNSQSTNNTRTLEEEIMTNVSDNVRKFNKNWQANLTGSWVHEYIKSGHLKITSPDEFLEETLKGLTIGLLVNNDLRENLLKIASKGFQMNPIYSLGDLPHSLDIAYRPIDNLLRESHIIIYDSQTISEDLKDKINQGKYISTVDVANVKIAGQSIFKKRLGIIGLGRIGSRVAQIASEGFDMRVAYYSRKRNFDLEKRYNLEFKPLDDLLSDSDIVTFHLPHVGAEGFVTSKMIDMIPKGTVVVNVSVGSIFEDQDYLLNRFQEDDLRGYLDVYKTLPPRMKLRDRKDYLVATYRLGWRTKSTIGLKTHKLITRLEEGLNK